MAGSGCVFQKCVCGNDEFDTTKTVYHDLKVKVDDRGCLVDGDSWTASEFQPSSPYGHFVCTVCGGTYRLEELLQDIED